jgi:hypothetical protein
MGDRMKLLLVLVVVGLVYLLVMYLRRRALERNDP